ncbi:hyaluronate lyase [Streptomyces sp. ERV7]|nr:hyaluronate lyase [Streptomyces sp. ERV7]
MAAAIPLQAAGPGATAPLGSTDHTRIVAAYRELQIGGNRVSPRRARAVAALDEVATGYDAAMTVTGDQLWPDLPVGPGSTYFPTMYYRLRTIAVDWATPGSALSTRPETPDRLVTALDTLYRTQYNENTAELGNWYSYEIGVPYWLLQTVVALGDRLPAAGRERVLRPVLRFVADPNRRTSNATVETGANRADKALITVVSGALADDATRVAAGIAAVTDTAGGGASDLTLRTTKGDGYHTDGSFIQHDVVPYPGHYGLVLLSAIAGLTYVTHDTAVGLAPAVREKFEQVVTDVHAPFLFAGSMMETVRGRMLSRQGETGHDAGHQFIAAAVLLARTATGETRRRLSRLAARWIAEGTWAPYLDVSDVGRFSGGLQPVGVPEVEFAEQLPAVRARSGATALHRTFPQMDRMVHTTERWSASLGTGSSRICRYEAINGMNLHGWYTGDGVLYTFLPGRQGQYSDAYWPTVDATLLPGTTTKDAAPPPLLTEPPRTTRTFAGGARFDDRYGVQALDFVSQDGTLSAKKSWFLTPDAVVCLGAAITDTSGAPVRTAIENRGLGEDGTPGLLIDGRPDTSPLGRPTVVRHARWLHLDGTGGYVLLDGHADKPLTLLREDRTGTWLGIDTGANTHGTSTPYTRRYQKIVVAHGVRPAGASYAYAVLPGATATETRRATGRWTVLANSEHTQAIRLDAHLTAAVFFAPGAVDGLRTSGPTTAVWGRTPKGWSCALADPSQTQDSVRVTVDVAAHRVVRADPTVTVVATHPRLVVDIEVAGSLGATHSFTVD